MHRVLVCFEVEQPGRFKYYEEKKPKSRDQCPQGLIGCLQIQLKFQGMDVFTFADLNRIFGR